MQAEDKSTNYFPTLMLQQLGKLKEINLEVSHSA